MVCFGDWITSVHFDLSLNTVLQIRLSGLLHSDENCALKVEDSVFFLFFFSGWG